MQIRRYTTAGGSAALVHQASEAGAIRGRTLLIPEG
jgi:hypothetical protein